MSNDERRDSLADQAAAWVPPWQRPTAPATPPGGEDPGGSTPPEGPGVTGVAEDAAATPAARAESGVDPAAPDASGAPAASAAPAESAAPAVSAPPAGSEALAGSEASAVDAAPTASATAGAGGPGGTAGPPETGGPGEATRSPGALGPPAGGARGSGAAGVPAKGPAGRRRSAPEPPPRLDDAELRGALEAILLVVDEPVSELVLAQVLEQSAERVGPVLDEIAAGYTAAGHGFELRRAAGGWRLYTRPEYATYVERFVLDGQSVRLTQAALETLAVVAYKQPVTRSRISAIRGVNCDGVIRTLVSRGLVEECGTEPDSGAFLYRTTTMFLEKLGLNSVDDLPPLAPFLPDDVEELADATR
ncbi:SMC-Scp complex subunit ScpB [Micromonospora sp. CPCC 205561]|uniref:SMC-Scp complex subunit ScpB n=1 Tax=Micromonospora sp. CPCC 205561 TaxID=3122407 RepID=UPI002FEEABE0